jgi:hypothetical protein
MSWRGLCPSSKNSLDFRDMNPTDPKNMAIGLLRELCRQVQSLRDDQLAELFEGTAKLEVRIIGRKKLRTSTRKRRLTDEELINIAESLKSCQTREEGNIFLDQRIASKDDAVRLAKLLDLPLQKTDTAEQIRARTIESTIGFRIRSAAVQGVLKEWPDKSQTK